MKINYYHDSPYREFETERLQDELVELDRHLDDVQQDPELSRIAQTHKFLAEVALFERIL